MEKRGAVKKGVSALDVARYKGEWLALEPVSYRVVAHAVTLQAAEQGARQKGVQRPVMFPVSNSDHPFVGHGVILSRKGKH